MRFLLAALLFAVSYAQTGEPIQNTGESDTTGEVNPPSTATPTDSLSTATPTDSVSTATPTDSLSTAIPTDSLSTATPTDPLSTATPTDSLSTATPADSSSITSTFVLRGSYNPQAVVRVEPELTTTFARSFGIDTTVDSVTLNAQPDYLEFQVTSENDYSSQFQHVSLKRRFLRLLKASVKTRIALNLRNLMPSFCWQYKEKIDCFGPACDQEELSEGIIEACTHDKGEALFCSWNPYMSVCRSVDIEHGEFEIGSGALPMYKPGKAELPEAEDWCPTQSPNDCKFPCRMSKKGCVEFEKVRLLNEIHPHSKATNSMFKSSKFILLVTIPIVLSIFYLCVRGYIQKKQTDVEDIALPMLSQMS